MKQTLGNKLKPDIHNYDQRINSVLRRIKNALPDNTIQLIKKYHSEMISESISKATQLKHLRSNAKPLSNIKKTAKNVLKLISWNQTNYTTAFHNLKSVSILVMMDLSFWLLIKILSKRA